VFSLGMLARAAQAQHSRGSDQLGGTLDRVATLAQEALIEMRSLLFELRPTTLVDEGLVRALAKLVDVVGTRTGLAITYTASGEARLAPAQESAVFRIVQEALGNAAKHAQASAVTVVVTAAAEGVVVTVRDDGIGFDLATPAVASADGARGGQGLRSMRERAAATGLRLEVASRPGEGTAISVAAPGL
jgi:signal transduction histidine kinase